MDAIEYLGIFTPRLADSTIRTSGPQVLAEAKALGVGTVRAEQDITQPIAGDIRVFVNAGMKIVLTVRNNPQLGDKGKPTVVPPSTPDDLAAFRANLNRTLDSVKPVLLVVENEEVGSPFVSGTADQYVAELSAAIEVGHARGIPVTNGGITSGTVALLTWKDLYDRGLGAEADDFARRSFSQRQPETSQRQRLLEDLLAKPFNGFKSQNANDVLAKGQQLIDAYRKLPMDYVNFHWYIDSDQSLRQSIEYLRRVTGREVVTHEIGQYTKDPAVVTGHLNTLADMGMPFVLWFDADGDPSVGLHDDPGALRPTGDAFAATVPGVTKPS